MEIFWQVWKLSGQSGNFLDNLETFRTVWKLSGQSGNFPDSLETFRTVKKLPGNCQLSEKYWKSLVTVWKVWLLSGKFGNCLAVWKKFGQYGNCPDSQKLSRESGNLNYKLILKSLFSSQTLITTFFVAFFLFMHFFVVKF